MPIKPAAQTLAGLLDRRTLLPAAEVLVHWADERQPGIRAGVTD